MASDTSASARTIALINMAICEQHNLPFGVRRAHNLDMIDKQYQQLHNSSFERRVAHVSYMINQLQPFVSANRSTAVLFAQMMIETKHPGSESQVVKLGGLLKHDVSVDIVEKAIEI